MIDNLKSKFYIPAKFQSLKMETSKAGKPYGIMRIEALEDNGIHDFSVFGDTLKLARDLKPNSIIGVAGSIKSNSYNDKFYTRLNVSAVKKIADAPLQRIEPALDDLGFDIPF